MDGTAFGEVIVTAVKNYVEKQLGPLQRRLDEMERREKDLRYVGTYTAGVDYDPGNFATHDGSLWHCNVQTRAAPGSGSDWTLAVKRGRDGRDAR